MGTPKTTDPEYKYGNSGSTCLQQHITQFSVYTLFIATNVLMEFVLERERKSERKQPTNQW